MFFIEPHAMSPGCPDQSFYRSIAGHSPVYGGGNNSMAAGF